MLCPLEMPTKNIVEYRRINRILARCATPECCEGAARLAAVWGSSEDVCQPTGSRPGAVDENGAMEPMALDERTLTRLVRLSELADPPPWTSSVEGRDHESGDTFIMIGAAEDRREDLYLSRDSGPADGATHDLIAAARNALPLLIEEVQRLRSTLREP